MPPARRARGKRAGGAESARLRTYRAKRDFAATPEPAPGESTPGDAPRFVIHEHHATRLHWDLRLERDGALASWALPKGLPEAPKDNRFAAATEDHPLEYLGFEGEIPKGQYGAGRIAIWDRGTYECLKWEPRKVEVALHGERVEGRYALFPIDRDGDPKNWMIHRMDPPADPDREPMPRQLAPMLARAGELPDDSSGEWAHEIKWDGVRAVAYSEPGELRLESRNLIEITERYPELARLNRALSSHSAVLDGEIVALGKDGRPSFAALQLRMHAASKAAAKRHAAQIPVIYMIFDLLWLDGHSLMDAPYGERRARLRELALSGEHWQTPEHVIGEGRALLEATAAQGLEGILAKRLDSTYEPGRRARAWIKVKTVGRQELVVGGWMPGKGKRSQSIGALLLGVHEDGALRYAGRVGSGFSDAELARLEGLLGPLRRASSPFTVGERPPRGAVFCEPRLVVEVEFTEWTSAGSLRHPTYKGLREDRAPEEVVREDGGPAPGEAVRPEEVVREDGGPAPGEAGRPSPTGAAPSQTAAARAGGRARRPEPPAAGALEIQETSATSATTTVEGRELKLSNLTKVLYPSTGLAKRGVIDYYAAVAPVLLGHLQGRALTVTRWPDGVEAKSFYQKQAPSHRPDWVRTARLPAGSKQIDYVLAEDLATLVWLANLAAIELHTPLARAERVDCPRTLVFDLDPGPPAGVIECAEVALRLQGMFEHLGLQSFIKTSGSKGLQVYVPLNDDGVSFEQTKPFARTVAELLEQGDPELVVSRMTKTRRTGRVLIDWSQNDRNKTTVCVYSLRATPRPTVSTPLEWAEVRSALEDRDPAALAFQAHQVLERVAERGDLFAPVLSLVQRLPT